MKLAKTKPAWRGAATGRFLDCDAELEYIYG